MKELYQSIFDEMDMITEIDIGTFFKTAWKTIRRHSIMVQRLPISMTCANSGVNMTLIWQRKSVIQTNSTNDFKNNVDDLCKTFPIKTLFPVSTDGIHNHIKNLKKGKASGPDCLTNEHILYGGNILLCELCELFNLILESKYVPEMFKTCKIV